MSYDVSPGLGQILITLIKCEWQLSTASCFTLYVYAIMSDRSTLRPYYDRDTFNAGYSVVYKPGVGLVDTSTNKSITSSMASTVMDESRIKGLNPGKGVGINSKHYNLATKDKNYVYDLEFQEYFDVSNLVELFKNLVWNFCKNYLKTVVSQPLEIVRLVLQVGKFESKTAPKSMHHSRLLDRDGYSDSDSEPEYFQSKDVNLSALLQLASPRKRLLPTHRKIRLASKHTVDIMSSIVNDDGPFALFRGINASFIYNTLSHTVEAWITGFLSPLLGIPDPFFLELTHSTDPFRSLLLSVSACVLTGFFLMPLDLIKIRLMITQFNKSQDDRELPSVNTRSIRDSIRHYPVNMLVKPPTSITILTAFYQLSSSIFRKVAPYILFIKFNIDNVSSPTVFTVVNLALLILEFFIKLPVENLLRKEQVRFLMQPKTTEEDPMRVVTIDNPEENLIVDFNNGFYDMNNTTFLQRLKKLELFNGWRVGVLNVVGFWGYNILKTNGPELKQERL